MTSTTFSSRSSSSNEEGGNRLPLDAIFAPRTVAVIGATEKQGSVGRAVLWNLISNPFGATVYPINSNRPSLPLSGCQALVDPVSRQKLEPHEGQAISWRGVSLTISIGLWQCGQRTCKA